MGSFIALLAYLCYLLTYHILCLLLRLLYYLLTWWKCHFHQVSKPSVFEPSVFEPFVLFVCRDVGSTPRTTWRRIEKSELRHIPTRRHGGRLTLRISWRFSLHLRHSLVSFLLSLEIGCHYQLCCLSLPFFHKSFKTLCFDRGLALSGWKEHLWWISLEVALYKFEITNALLLKSFKFSLHWMHWMLSRLFWPTEKTTACVGIPFFHSPILVTCMLTSWSNFLGRCLKCAV